MAAKTTKDISDYFPDVVVPIDPCQDWAIVQMKKSDGGEKTRGGVYLPTVKSEDEKNQEEWHECMAKVIAIGPVFQRNRETLDLWPECIGGRGIKVGDIVRIPEFVSGRFTVMTPSGDEIRCIFVRDTQIMGRALDAMDTIDRVKSYVPVTQRKI